MSQPDKPPPRSVASHLDEPMYTVDLDGRTRSVAMDPAGLEVAVTCPSQHHISPGEGVEVIPDDAPKFVIQPAEKIEMANKNFDASTNLSLRQSEQHTSKGRWQLWWRKRVVVPLTFLVIAIIGGAVVGGILGSKAKLGSSESSVPPPTAEAALISSLSATSFICPGSYSMLLAYLDRENNIKYSARVGSDRFINSSWTKPQIISDEKKPSKDSGIAIATADRLSDISFYIYYTDQDSNLTTWSYSLSEKTPRFEREILKGARETLINTKFAAYSVWVTFQDKLGWGQLLRLPSMLSDTLPEQTWFPPSVEEGVPTLKGGKVSFTPLRTNVTNKKEPFCLAVLSQTDDRSLNADIYFESTEDLDDDDMRKIVDQSWPREFPNNITLPAGASFATFATAYAYNSTKVNTYILYQDENRNIQQVWTEGGENWQHSSPEAMRNVDAGTDIACITMNVENDSEDTDAWTYPVFLAYYPTLRRCYFQRGGDIIEVGMFGSDWELIGIVPQ